MQTLGRFGIIIQLYADASASIDRNLTPEWVPLTGQHPGKGLRFNSEFLAQCRSLLMLGIESIGYFGSSWVIHGNVSVCQYRQVRTFREKNPIK